MIFFGENISSPSQIAAVVQQFNRAQQQSPVQAPLLLMTDQEGGLVSRLPGAPVLSAKQIGQAADPSRGGQLAGTAPGRTSRGVGMNVNLAPVLDVYHQPATSSTSTSAPSAATRHRRPCGSFITAQQTTGVAATAKHFPGLGVGDRPARTPTPAR